MKTVAEVIDYIGQDRVKRAFGVNTRRLNQCRQFNQLSALWYDALERMAGRPLPRDLFSFKDVQE
jgi:hypothetical protein